MAAQGSRKRNAAGSVALPAGTAWVELRDFESDRLLAVDELVAVSNRGFRLRHGGGREMDSTLALARLKAVGGADCALPVRAPEDGAEWNFVSADSPDLVARLRTWLAACRQVATNPIVAVERAGECN